MKVSVQPIIALFLIGGLLSSCREFIEPSIENDKVFLNAPADSAESNRYLQSFWWEPVEDALAYRLQIVTPSFDRPSQLILDSLVKDTKFSYTLDPGSYQWRVRGENGSSQTLYTTRSFMIHESTITTQQVQLKGPPNGLITNQAAMLLSWYSIYGAGFYQLQVDSGSNNFTDEDRMVVNAEISATEYRFSQPADAVYSWRVKAKNDTAESKWSAIYSFTADRTDPPRVTLISPPTGQVVSSPVSLRWNGAADAKTWQLHVMKTDSTGYDDRFPLTLTTTSYSFTLGSSGEQIIWKVRAIDAAGNTGEYSEARNFTIQ